MLKVRFLSVSRLRRLSSSVPLPDIDTNYYCDVKNAAEIKHNIQIRKGLGDIDRVLDTYKLYSSLLKTDNTYNSVKSSLYKELSSLPNRTHPTVCEYNQEPLLVNEINNRRDFKEYIPLEFSEITRRLNLMRTDKLGYTCGHKSYFFLGELAELEEALIKYSVSFLLARHFELVSVPDILPSNVLQSCGMTVNSDRKQIYSLDPHHHGPDLYLSGTAEMSLAGLLMNTVHDKHKLPLKLAAVSRCYRAETSNVIEERGIYRVHQFTKVEMFAVTIPEESDEMLEYIRKTQEELFTALGIHMRVLDMPPHELGAPAYRMCLDHAIEPIKKNHASRLINVFTPGTDILYRKYDIEAWMPGRNSYGEISSCSNCTDYQSRRLHIKCKENGVNIYTHTLNGTACALPRMLIALLETHQDPKGKILIPKVLQPFMNGKTYIGQNSIIPELKLIKIKK